MATSPETSRAVGPVIDDQADPSREWYDRSSLRGDYLVMIPDQTEQEYLRRHPPYPFCEFIDGTVYIHAPVKDQHQYDVQLLLTLLVMFDSVRGAGVVLSGPAGLRIGDGSWLEPDVFVLPIASVRDDGDLSNSPPALLVVEVLSRSNRTLDLGRKTELYREADAAELWFIDRRDRAVIVDRRSADGREVSRVGSGPLRSTGLPGFWCDVDWLWAEPRPNLFECLDRILAGPPA